MIDATSTASCYRNGLSLASITQEEPFDSGACNMHVQDFNVNDIIMVMGDTYARSCINEHSN